MLAEFAKQQLHWTGKCLLNVTPEGVVLDIYVRHFRKGRVIKRLILIRLHPFKIFIRKIHKIYNIYWYALVSKNLSETAQRINIY